LPQRPVWRVSSRLGEQAAWIPCMLFVTTDGYEIPFVGRDE